MLEFVASSVEMRVTHPEEIVKLGIFHHGEQSAIRDSRSGTKSRGVRELTWREESPWYGPVLEDDKVLKDVV